ATRGLMIKIFDEATQCLVMPRLTAMGRGLPPDGTRVYWSVRPSGQGTPESDLQQFEGIDNNRTWQASQMVTRCGVR
ncbi:hypothetical protein BaRGS_00040533, partial [Batillaria attramentaria]